MQIELCAQNVTNNQNKQQYAEMYFDDSDQFWS